MQLYKNIIIVFVFMIKTNFTFGQKTMSDVERYIFDSLFQTTALNNVTQIIEEDEAAQVTRKWFFNEKGQLAKECDWRVRGSSPSSWFGYSSTTTYKEYNYEYNSDEKIRQILDTEVQNGDTLKTIHKFDYSTNNVIKESFRAKTSDLIVMECIFLSKFKDGLLDSKTFLIFSDLGYGKTEIKNNETYQYNERNVLSKKDNYFSLNFYPKDVKDVKEELTPEELSVTSKYDYDELGRIVEIIEYEFDEKKEKKLNRKVQFEYEKDNLNISHVNINYGESYTPREVRYSVIEKNGNVQQIKVNDKTYYYKIEKK